MANIAVKHNGDYTTVADFQNPVKVNPDLLNDGEDITIFNFEAIDLRD